jgi:hypothetical protein
MDFSLSYYMKILDHYALKELWNANIARHNEYIGKFVKSIQGISNGLKAHGLIMLGFTNRCLVYCVVS